jgi:hypothetical protein
MDERGVSDLSLAQGISSALAVIHTVGGILGHAAEFIVSQRGL